MCGIFGQILLSDKALSREDAVRKGTAFLSHRGPDGEGLVRSDRFIFGHRRLAIIDVAGGIQPMWSQDKRGCLTFNGEVYNFKEIRADLERLGIEFHTRSDTEVVLQAWLTWGIEALDRFRGMFAFAAVDLQKEKALVVRDRLGVKPLYYHRTSDSLFFSSELEALYQAVGPFSLDPEGLDEYLGWQYIHAPRTIYRDVQCLPPGHALEIDLRCGTIVCRTYWNLEFCEDSTLSLVEWEERLDAALRESVQLRLISDVPFGAFLSGGIDSSLVVAYMSEILEKPVNTFTIGFKDSDYDETKYAEIVAHRCRTRHFTEIVEPDSFGLLPLLVKHFGQPFADSSAIPTYYVSHLARRHVTMILSGDGGDENFAGYNSYEWVIKKLPTSEDADQRVGARAWLKSILSVWANFRQTKAGPSPELVEKAFQLHCQTAKHFSPAERASMYLPAWKSIVRDFPPQRREAMNLPGQPIITRLQHLDLKNYLPFDILTKVDITAMANSLEVRTPLLDHRLVELAARIPAQYKLMRHESASSCAIEKKLLLKKLASRWFPDSIIQRSKMGFGVPMGRWLAGPLRPMMEQRLLHSTVLGRIFDISAIAQLVQSHSLSHNVGTKLWNLLVLEEWMRTHQNALP